MKNSIESWRFPTRPTQEEYDKALTALKVKLMRKKNITSLDHHKFLMIEDSNNRVIHMWLVPKDFKE